MSRRVLPSHDRFPIPIQHRFQFPHDGPLLLLSALEGQGEQREKQPIRDEEGELPLLTGTMRPIGCQQGIQACLEALLELG